MLKYIGADVIISHKGIYFNDGDKDKYNYLGFAIELLKAISYETNQNVKHTHNIRKLLSASEMEGYIYSYHEGLKQHLKQKIDDYKKTLENQFLEIENKPNLNSIEKSIYLNNLNLMKNYKIQREINEIFYKCSISSIIDVIKHRKIKEIEATFNEPFLFILQDIQKYLNINLKSKLETINNNESIFIKLIIYNNL